MRADVDRSPLDAAPIPTAVIRNGLLVYANEACAALSGCSVAELYGRRYTDFVAPEDVFRLMERQRARLRGEPVPAEYEAHLIGPSGERRLCRILAATVGSAGDTVVVHVVEVDDVSERRRRLTHLAQLGVDIQIAHDEERVFDRLLQGLPALHVAALLLRPSASTEGRVEVLNLGDDARAGLDTALGRPLTEAPWTWSGLAQRIWTAGVAFSDDAPLDLARAFSGGGGSEELRQVVIDLRLHQAIGVRLDRIREPFAILLLLGDWLQEADLPAFRLFGSQVSTALDVGSTIRDLSRRNAELASMNRLARAARSSLDLPEFLRTGGKELVEAAGCAGFAVYLFDPETREAVLRYRSDPGMELAEEVARLAREDAGAGAAAERSVRVVQAEEQPALARERFAQAGLATFAVVPLEVRSSTVGVLVVAFRARRAPAECNLDLLQAMAAHFAAAIESQRLLGDLRHKVSELTLLNDLAVASSTLDPKRLIENALVRVLETLEADVGSGHLLDAEGFSRIASVGLSPETMALLDSSGKVFTGLTSRAGVELAPVVIPRLADVSEQGRYLAEKEGIETGVAVPLVANNRPIGSLLIGRRTPRPFVESEVSLLVAVGAQLGVAVDGVRQFAETRRRVEELSLIHEVGRTIAASLDLDRVLREGAEAVRKLTDATRCSVLLYDASREELRLGAVAGDELPRRFWSNISLSESDLAVTVVRERRPLAIENADEGSEDDDEIPASLRAKSKMAAPLLLRDEPVGVVVVEERRGRRRYGPAEVDRVMAVAHQLAVAIDNARLYAEAQRRLADVAAVNDLARVASSSLELDQVLEAGAEHMMRTLDAAGCCVLLADARGLELRRAAVRGQVIDLEAVPLDRPSIFCEALEQQAPVVGQLDREDQEPLPALVVPLRAREQPLGLAVITDRPGARAFTEAEMTRALAIANQLALAVENARLYEDLRKSYAELARTQEQLVQRERLAALGELSAVVAHEVRNPLGVIFNSLGSIRRLVRPDGDAKVLLDIMGEEADRLNRIVGDLLDFARPTTPTLRPEPIDRVLDDALQAALAENPQGIRLIRDVDPSLPPVAMDSRLVRQALINIAVNAVQAMQKGGTLTARAFRDGEFARIEIADQGPGIPEEVQHRIFEPFFTTKASGTGLGLAVVKRILEGHRGEFAVSSSRDGTVFVIWLPIEEQPGANPSLRAQRVVLRSRMG